MGMRFLMNLRGSRASWIGWGVSCEFVSLVHFPFVFFFAILDPRLEGEVDGMILTMIDIC